MKLSERILKLQAVSRKLGESKPESMFMCDLHEAALNKFNKLKKSEKIARSMADAIVKQPILINEDDTLFGRNFCTNIKKPEKTDKDLIVLCYEEDVLETIPDYLDMYLHGYIFGTVTGHSAWDFNKMLRLGTMGIKEQINDYRLRTDDLLSHEFYDGVEIVLTAVEDWSEAHAKELDEMGKKDLAEICRRVPKYPARNFREAVQSFFMQHILVLAENYDGGNSPGRLDYFLWPYLEKDLKEGVITLEEAWEIICELFIRLDEQIHIHDGFVEAIVVGGIHPNGQSAINPLSYMMIEVFIELNITHPAVYVRLPEDAPEDFVDLCAKYMKNGGNRAQLFYDKNIIRALVKDGVNFQDASMYYSGGCMEIGIQGKNGDFLYNGWSNIPKMLECSVTGGISLTDGKKLEYSQAKGLINYNNYDEFYDDFIKEVRRVLTFGFKLHDEYAKTAETNRPSYLLSSMVSDCIERGRNVHAGGAMYDDYGSTPMGLANTADGLIAIKKAVFEDKICSAEELVVAMSKNYEGYEPLRRKLMALPKYGQGIDEADAIMTRLCEDIANIYSSFVTRHGARAKVVILTFSWAATAGNQLGATPDGHFAKTPVAHGVTPQSSSMTKGITAAINSCCKIPFEKFSGGASTMWDMDEAWASEEIIKTLFTVFFRGGGQIFQGNTTNVEELLKAKENPEDYPNLIVRVGGFSARFTRLGFETQDDIINRLRHKG